MSLFLWSDFYYYHYHHLLTTTAPTAMDSFDFDVSDIIPIIAFGAVEEELQRGKSRLPIIPGVGIAVISSIDSINKAASVLRALSGGMVAAIVVVITSWSGRKRGTLLENNSNLI